MPKLTKPSRVAIAPNELGLRNGAFEGDDLQAVGLLAANGYGLVGDIGQSEHLWRIAYVLDPEGIIVSLVQRVGWAGRINLPSSPVAAASG